VQIHRDQLAEVAPLWLDLALRFWSDAAVERAWGWVQEVRFALSLILFLYP